MSFWDALAAALTGVLSGWGVGGGSLLILWMTGVRGIPQAAARGLNLAYFLTVSLGALPGHFRQGRVAKRVLLCCLAGGIPAAAGMAALAPCIAPELLQKLFGIFLLIIGARELFAKGQ